MQTSTVNLALDAMVPIEMAAKSATKPTTQVEHKQVEQKFDKAVVEKLQTELSNHDISLKFSRDDMTNHIVVQMIDDKTGEAIRQFPTEVSLSLAANFMKLQGVFIDVEK